MKIDPWSQFGAEIITESFGRVQPLFDGDERPVQIGQRVREVDDVSAVLIGCIHGDTLQRLARRDVTLLHRADVMRAQQRLRKHVRDLRVRGDRVIHHLLAGHWTTTCTLSEGHFI